MPGPAVEPPVEWCTTTNYPAGAEPWNGNPRRVAPSGGQSANGVTPGDTLPAPWWNFLLGRMTAWILYFRSFWNATTDEIVYPVTKARRIILSPASLEPVLGSWESPGGVFVTGARGSLVEGSVLLADVKALIPAGSTLESVDVLLNPGAARATVGDRVTVDLVSQTPDFDTPAAYGVGSSIGLARDDGTSSTQVVTLAAVGEEITSLKTYQLLIYSGQDAGAHASDVIYAVRLNVTEQGPSNFGVDP